MRATYSTWGLPLASHLRLMSSVGKTTRRRGDCSVMTGGSITGNKIRKMGKFMSGWCYGLNLSHSEDSRSLKTPWPMRIWGEEEAKRHKESEIHRRDKEKIAIEVRER